MSAQEKLNGLCASCVAEDERTLTGPALRGRGSGTEDEHRTAEFAAKLFASFGLKPGGDGDSFLQRGTLPNPLPGFAPRLLKHLEPVERTSTWNVIGVLPGKTRQEAILLSAHLDHLGTGAPAKDGSPGPVYPGADDDASGTTAVLELARTLSKEPRPRRTIVFVLFGAEELGGLGDKWFLEHPTIPLNSIVANLEFEMIGRADPAIAANQLWLTGYERSDLGPELAKHGALLVADPHPAEQFFRRSDNYNLALRGIVAHTVSSYGLHRDYHQPTDTFERLDLSHMTAAIASMIPPIEWLSNTEWQPRWRPGGEPQ